MKPDDTELKTGACACGSCKFELRGPHNWVGHCHCESCRKATASPMTTWIGQENGTWELKGDEPKTYSSSKGVTRGFCGKCGSPMFFKADRYPNEVHFYATLLDDPSAIEPTEHYHYGEKLGWLHLSDNRQ